MNVELLAVGTELLLGDIVNGNAAWLGQRLAEAGLDVSTSVVVGDNEQRIAAAVLAALGRADAVVLTGGLGPTQDDVTREALARAAGVPLRRDDGLVEQLRARYAGRGRSMPERNLRQADLPAGAGSLPNPVGSAPGLRLELAGGVAYALPGVPHEMERMFLDHVLPDLLGRAGQPAVIASRVLRVVGMWESAVAEALGGLHASLDEAGNPTLAYLAGGGQVRVRITAKAASRAAAEQLIGPVETDARRLLGVAVYGADDETLDLVVHRLLRAQRATVGCAESLTGGLLGASLTELPGASVTFRGSLVAYATGLKADLLGVPVGLLESVGPVAEETARAMAEGARERLAATYGLAVTGVAGPDPQDGVPPGTVFVGLAGPHGAETRRLSLPGDRPRVRTYAVVSALDLMRRHLMRVAEGR